MAIAQPRRGLFRAWIVVTALALIGAPIWLMYGGMSEASHTCFEITEFRLKNTQSVLAGMQLPMTICTDPELIDNPKRHALERNWTDIESLTVNFGHHGNDVETFAATKNSRFMHLYTRADMRFQKAVFFDLLRHEVPIIEGVVIVLAIAVWWLGRLVAVIGAWIRRGFEG